jgi:hypothetical protein
VRTTALDASDAMRTAACLSQSTLVYVTQPESLVPGEGLHVGMSNKTRVTRMGSQLEMSMEKVACHLDGDVAVSIHCHFRGLSSGRHHVDDRG